MQILGGDRKSYAGSLESLSCLPVTLPCGSICLFGVLRRFQHCTGHITTGSWKGRGNQYIEFARVVYCKLPTNGKQLPAFPLTAMMGIDPRPQRWEAKVLPLCHRGPCLVGQTRVIKSMILWFLIIFHLLLLFGNVYLAICLCGNSICYKWV